MGMELVLILSAVPMWRRRQGHRVLRAEEPQENALALSSLWVPFVPLSEGPLCWLLLPQRQDAPMCASNGTIEYLVQLQMVTLINLSNS
jgi:hypothetical protein